MLSAPEVRALRLRALRLDGHAPCVSVMDAATWTGAMQAQDLASVMWSLGLRIPGQTSQSIADALGSREVLRTWPMRGTIHLVPARDARWMVDLMSAKPLAGAASRREYLGLTEAIADRAVEVLSEALSGGRRLTRSACLDALRGSGIEVTGQIGYHLLWYASQVGVTCIGPQADGQQTFVLLDEWAPDPERLGRDEAMTTIALRYFQGHGPATVTDLARWTGLGVREVRAAIADAGDSLVQIDTVAGPMVVTRAALESGAGVGGAAGAGVGRDHDGAHPSGKWLTPPGFDEFMLGYGDRGLFLDPTHMKAVVPGSNGVFRATLVRDGWVVGTWTRTLSASAVVIEASALVALRARDRRAFEAALAEYGAFLGRERVRVTWA